LPGPLQQLITVGVVPGAIEMCVRVDQYQVSEPFT
jgi:hypothetical protein